MSEATEVSELATQILQFIDSSAVTLPAVPLVKHYRQAQFYRHRKGSEFARDCHVLGQMLGLVAPSDFEGAPPAYQLPYHDALAAANAMPRRRAAKVDGEFRILDCACCRQLACVPLCDCENPSCRCENPRVVYTLRSPTMLDLIESTRRSTGDVPYEYQDEIELAGRCTKLKPEEFDALPWSEFRVLDMAIFRMERYPLGLWHVSPPAWYGTS